MMKKQISFIATLFVSGIIAISCTQQQPNPEAELRVLWDDFITAWEAEDAKACAGFYAADGVNIPPEFNVNLGAEGVESFYTFLFSMNQSSKYTHDIHSVSWSGNLAVERGEYKVDWVSNDGSPWTYNARSITHWEKNENGQWKIKAFLFNTPPSE